MVLLAIIGFIFLMWFASKALFKVGDVFEKMSQRMEERALTAAGLRAEQVRTLHRIEKEMKKIKSHEGLQAQKELEAWEIQAKKEIDELTQ